jgi:hypothetical protein
VWWSLCDPDRPAPQGRIHDPLFARLKARAASERGGLMRSAATLPRLDGALAMESHQLSNAGLFEPLDPCAAPLTFRT